MGGKDWGVVTIAKNCKRGRVGWNINSPNCINYLPPPEDTSHKKDILSLPAVKIPDKFNKDNKISLKEQLHAKYFGLTQFCYIRYSYWDSLTRFLHLVFFIKQFLLVPVVVS